MKNLYLKKQKIFFKFFVFLFFVFVATINFTFSEVSKLQDGDRVAEGSEVIYYLNVYYDGIDRMGVDSTTIDEGEDLPEISSKEISIVDQLPAGMTFVEFIAPTSGNYIGSVRQDDSSVSCLGGVDFTELTTTNSTDIVNSTGKVDFTIEGMQAGCMLTVGLKVTVDELPTGETRRDYYNSFTAQDGEQLVVSNTVHLWAGNDGETLIEVHYVYEEPVPSNAPAVPSVSAYVEGSTVKVAPDAVLENYEFSGWESDDVVVNSDGTFVMPSGVVTFFGSFTEKASNIVSYKIEGDLPDDYVVPEEKTYYVDSLVTLDTLAAGTEVGGYRFLGWTLPSDVTLDDNGQFVMPNKDVEIVGQFEELLYEVSYQFQGDLPEKSEQYLPTPHTFAPGDVVTLKTVDAEVLGYEFVGWLKEDGFVMPKENVVVVGEWVAREGYFNPLISIEAYDDVCIKFDPSEQCYISPRVSAVEVVTTVENDDEVPITDVIITLPYSTSCSEFSATYDDFECVALSTESNEFIISSIPVDGVVTMPGSYYPYNSGKITLEAEIVGALAGNNFVLEDKEYIAQDEIFVKSVLSICNNLEGNSRGSKNQYLVESEKFTTTMVVSDNSCGSIFVSPGVYTIKQIEKQDYGFVSFEGHATYDSDSGLATVVVPDGTDEQPRDNYRLIYDNKIVNNKWFRLWDREANMFTLAS